MNILRLHFLILWFNFIAESLFPQSRALLLALLRLTCSFSFQDSSRENLACLKGEKFQSSNCTHESFLVSSNQISILVTPADEFPGKPQGSCLQARVNECRRKPQGRIIHCKFAKFLAMEKSCGLGKYQHCHKEDKKYMCCRNRAMKPWDVKSLFRLWSKDL